MSKHHESKKRREKPKRRENSSSNHQTRWTSDDEKVLFEEPDDDFRPPPRRQTMPEDCDYRSRSRHGGRDRSLPRGQPVNRTPAYEQPRRPATPRREIFTDDEDDVPSRPHHSRHDRSSHQKPPPKRSSQPIYKEPWGPAAPRRQTLPGDYGYNLPAAPPPPPPPMYHQQGFVPPSPMQYQQGFVQVPPPPMHYQQGFVQAPYPPAQVPPYYTSAPQAIPRARSPTKERFTPKTTRGDRHTQGLPVSFGRINVKDLPDPKHGYMAKGKVRGIEEWIDQTEEEKDEEERRGLH
ncbi:hypothetical protein ACEPAH_3375 [Sanghuangporus vaninii]